MVMVGSEIGRLPPQFGDAALIANAILNCGYEFDTGKLVYNYYKSVVSYDTTSIPIFSQDTGANSEQSSRMTAMDNSSKNAAEMIDKLRITFNRTRQAVITGELIEIISGAAAL